MGSEETDKVDDAVTLWRPTGERELALVREAKWRAWPPRLPEQPIFYPVIDRAYATKIAREWNVPSGRVGYVTSFRVKRVFLDRYRVEEAGGHAHREYWIRAEHLDEMNANIEGVIRVEAEYRGPVADEVFTSSEHALGGTWPAEWKNYLQGKSWLRSGWMPGPMYVSILRPDESADAVAAWGEAAALHPGVAILGTDGSREQLAIDLREAKPKVVLVDISSGGWENAVVQAESIEAFIGLLESERFEFRFEG